MFFWIGTGIFQKNTAPAILQVTIGFARKGSRPAWIGYEGLPRRLATGGQDPSGKGRYRQDRKGARWGISIGIIIIIIKIVMIERGA